MGRPDKSRAGTSFDVTLWGAQFRGIPLEFEGDVPVWRVPAGGMTYQVMLPPQGGVDVSVPMPESKGYQVVHLPHKCLREITDNPTGRRHVLFVSNIADCAGPLMGKLAIHPPYAAQLVGKYDAEATSDSRRTTFDMNEKGVEAFRDQHGAMFEEVRLVAALTGVPEAEILAVLHHEGRFNIDAENLELERTLPLIRRTGMYAGWVKQGGSKRAEAEAVRFIRNHGFGDRGVGHFYKEPVLKKGGDGRMFISNVNGEGETWEKVAETGECAWIWRQLFPDKPLPKGRQESFFFSTLATACLMRKDSQRHNIPLTAKDWHPKARRLAFRGQAAEIPSVRGTKNLTDPYTQLVFSLRAQLQQVSRR